MWKRDLREAAERQHGVICSRDWDSWHASSKAFDHEMRSGDWQSRSHHVWSILGSPDTPEQRLMVGVLSAGPGTAISHHSAAALWELPGFDLEPVHLTRIRGTNSTTPPGTVVHRVRRLPSTHIALLGPFPVVGPELMLIQLAGLLPSGRTEILLDRLWSRRLLTGSSLDLALKEMSARGRRGVALLRGFLEDRGSDWTPPASGLEGRVRSVLEREGIPGFRLQANLGGSRWIARVDFAHEHLPIVLEVQSDHYHTALTDQRRDHVRHARLRTAGFQVIEIWESDVWFRPERWLGDVRAAIRSSAA